jgi:hypothetical protein
VQVLHRRGRRPDQEPRARRRRPGHDPRPRHDGAPAGPQPPPPADAPAQARRRPGRHRAIRRRTRRRPSRGSRTQHPQRRRRPRPRRPGPDYPGDPGPDDPGDPDDYDEDPGDPLPGYAGPDGAPAWSAEEAENARHVELDDPGERRGPLRPTQSAPPPANLNLIIPIGTLLGWSATPAQAGSFGLLDPDETRALAAAASRHPRTRWSVTLTDLQGRAIAHGRARGQHPWTPPPRATASPGTSPPDADHAAHLRHLIQALKIIFDPIAQDTCDHQQAENHYTPSRKLKDLIRARTQTCDAPGCNAQARYADLDHTTHYPDGPTDQCNLGPKCRRHHRAKQAPGWHVEQPQPGTTRWTLPNGRSHTTTPTIYDA